MYALKYVYTGNSVVFGTQFENFTVQCHTVITVWQISRSFYSSCDILWKHLCFFCTSVCNMVVYFSNLSVVYVCTCTLVHTYCTLGCPSTYNTCYMSRLLPTSHPTLPTPPLTLPKLPFSLHTPYTSTHSPHATVQPPHSILSAPHNLIPSPSAQTLINTSTSKSDINPP